jgi:diaminopimelate epimerase
VSRHDLTIPFVKASACGNDFLLICGAEVEGKLVAAERSEFTRRICDRHEGIGADGVEWMYPHAVADVEIRLRDLRERHALRCGVHLRRAGKRKNFDPNRSWTENLHAHGTKRIQLRV